MEEWLRRKAIDRGLLRLMEARRVKRSLEQNMVHIRINNERGAAIVAASNAKAHDDVVYAEAALDMIRDEGFWALLLRFLFDR